MINIVAEIGQNHNGQMDIAKRLINMAARCGCTHAKFQKRDIDSWPEAVKNRPYEKEHSYGKTFGEHRHYLEFSIEQHKELKEYCKENNIGYLCSVWDVVSARQIISLMGRKGHVKVPSAMMTNKKMLQVLGSIHQGLFILSTGMCSMGNINEALGWLHVNHSRIVMMQCTSCYPCSDGDLNLLMIDQFNHLSLKAVGFSGHHRGYHPDLIALGLGATWFERHITLDKNGKGSDHLIALERGDLRYLVTSLKSGVKVLGDPEKRFLECEKDSVMKLREVVL